MRRTTWLTVLIAACLVAAVPDRAAFPQAKPPPPKKVEVGRNVFVEIEDKKVVRVVVEAYVCLRQGALEHLLTRRHGKEHEAILAANIHARDLSTALLLAGAEAGRTVFYQPKGVPPSGSAVKISLAYKTREGKEVRVAAQQWVRHHKTKKDLETDWVFAGSGFVVDKNDPAKVFYLADDGDVICVANMEGAVLDVPILSCSRDNEYEAHTERIPPVETPVRVILEPVRAKKK